MPSAEEHSTCSTCGPCHSVTGFDPSEPLNRRRLFASSPGRRYFSRSTSLSWLLDGSVEVVPRVLPPIPHGLYSPPPAPSWVFLPTYPSCGGHRYPTPSPLAVHSACSSSPPSSLACEWSNQVQNSGTLTLGDASFYGITTLQLLQYTDRFYQDSSILKFLVRRSYPVRPMLSSTSVIPSPRLLYYGAAVATQHWE